MTTTITLYLRNGIGIYCDDGDGNAWSTVQSKRPAAYECMECGERISRAYYTQRDGVVRYLCPEHVTLVPVDGSVLRD